MEEKRVFFCRDYQAETDLPSLTRLVAREMEPVLPGVEWTEERVMKVLSCNPFGDFIDGGGQCPREIVVMGYGDEVLAMCDVFSFASGRGRRVDPACYLSVDDEALATLFNLMSLRARSIGCGMLKLDGRFPFGMGWLGQPLAMENTIRVLTDCSFERMPPYYTVMLLQGEGPHPTHEKGIEEVWTEQAGSRLLSLQQAGKEVAHCVFWPAPEHLKDSPYEHMGSIERLRINVEVGADEFFWGRELIARQWVRHCAEGGDGLMIWPQRKVAHAFETFGFKPFLSIETLERFLPM